MLLVSGRGERGEYSDQIEFSPSSIEKRNCKNEFIKGKNVIWRNINDLYPIYNSYKPQKVMNYLFNLYQRNYIYAQPFNLCVYDNNLSTLFFFFYWSNKST